mmetsp:Transcript_21980/g.30193  ORF Transcript_21980/g.30193 Transcript_21980/m.30193 type:complete len:345 (-) Transcript_21980:308-1342(-)
MDAIDNENLPSSSRDTVDDGGKKISIKFLIANSHAGSLIGTGGKSIKELVGVTNARVIVSGTNEVFPGTNDRVVLVAGSRNAVVLAQTLIWEMIAQNVKAGSDRSTEWSPQTVVKELGLNDDVEVVSKVSIPASVGGLILGRGGETIRAISTDTGAKIVMTSKEDALFTQERVLTISGGAGQCVRCVTAIVDRLDEQDEVAHFFNRGTTYSSPLIRGGFMAGMGFGGGRGGRGRGRGEGRGPGRGRLHTPTAPGDGDPETNITISIPNELVGNIFGKQGATMREIISLSGAKVVVSGRGEYVEGTTNRLVTITGAPSCAQAAHLFITRRLETPSNPPPKKNSLK